MALDKVREVDPTGHTHPKMGGGQGGGTDEIFILNDQYVTADYTIPVGKNAGTFGPIQINPGVVVTISPNSVWSIV